MTEEVYDMTLKTPFNMIISGSSGSGKTAKITKLLQFKDILLDEPTKQVIFFYSEWQDSYDYLSQLKLVDSFHRGIPSHEDLMTILEDIYDKKSNEKPHQLMIFDDLISEIQDDMMAKLFCVYGHHRNVSVILVTQALFNPRINRFNILQENVHYLILSKNPRDNSKVIYLAKQISPYNINWVVKAFLDATKDPFSYIFFDFKQNSADKLRLRTKIFPDENPIKIYVPPC